MINFFLNHGLYSKACPPPRPTPSLLRALRIGAISFVSFSLLKKNQVAFASPKKNLEEEFLELATQPVDIHGNGRLLIESYLKPNEDPDKDCLQSDFNPEKGKLHLCTGAERLFSNAGRLPERAGFIGIDVDPLVIAYNHFNTLLLKISKDREDYLWLARPVIWQKPCKDLFWHHTRTRYSLEKSCPKEFVKYIKASTIIRHDPPKDRLLLLQDQVYEYLFPAKPVIVSSKATQDRLWNIFSLVRRDPSIGLRGPVIGRYETIEDRIQLLQDRINKSNLSERWKDFYLCHLKDFCEIYYKPKTEFFMTPLGTMYGEYHRNKQTFEKVQRYAQEGQLIFLQRRINDLSFLKASRVEDIDVSNIPDYFPVGPVFQDSEINPSSEITIIWTKLYGGREEGTSYFSWKYDPSLLPKDKREELEALVRPFHLENPDLIHLESKIRQWMNLCGYLVEGIDFSKNRNQRPLCSYAPETIELLKKCPRENPD